MNVASIKRQANKAIERVGAGLVLRTVTEGAFDTDTNEYATVNFDKTVFGSTTSVSTLLASDTSNPFQIGDLIISLASIDSTGADIYPDENDLLIIDGITYKMLTIEAIYPKATNVYFRIIARKASV